ncbi:MAG: ArdC family protein [Fimbriimonas sp.]
MTLASFAEVHFEKSNQSGARVSTAIYESVTRTIIEALQKGVVPWKKPWHQSQSVPTNATTNRPYRGVNLFLLAMHPYADHRWLTLRQANELGGSVKPGQKATTVIFWKRWQPTNPEEGGEATRREIPILRYYKVFNAEQCTGLPLPELYEGREVAQHERIEKAELLAKLMPNPPEICEGGSSAWYRPRDDRVQIPELDRFESPDAFYATLFHELGHCTGHVSRLNRPGVTGQILFGSGEYSKEELVAELTSAFCAATVSLDDRIIGSSAAYIDGWLGVLKSDPKAVVIAAAQAQRAADLIRGVEYAT